MTRHHSSGTFTFDSDLNPVTRGFAVNRVGPCTRLSFAVDSILVADSVRGTAETPRRLGGCVGVWHDAENAVTVIDVVDVYDRLDTALAVARSRHQRYIGDIAGDRVVPV